MSQSKTQMLIEALQILEPHVPPNMSPVIARHDELIAAINESKLTDTELKRLEELGFVYSNERNALTYYGAW